MTSEGIDQVEAKVREVLGSHVRFGWSRDSMRDEVSVCTWSAVCRAKHYTPDTPTRSISGALMRDIDPPKHAETSSVIFSRENERLRLVGFIADSITHPIARSACAHLVTS